MNWSVLTILLCSGTMLLLSSSSSWTSEEGLGAGGGVMPGGRELGLPIKLMELPTGRHSLLLSLQTSMCVFMRVCVCMCVCERTHFAV